MVVRCHVGAGYQTQVLWKCSQCYTLLSHISKFPIPNFLQCQNPFEMIMLFSVSLDWKTGSMNTGLQLVFVLVICAIWRSLGGTQQTFNEYLVVE